MIDYEHRYKEAQHFALAAYEEVTRLRTELLAEKQAHAKMARRAEQAEYALTLLAKGCGFLA